MASSTRTERYTSVAIALHWAIAAAIVCNLLLGWWMGDALGEGKTQAMAITGFQLHKSLGLTVLVLSLLRLGWRLAHRPPPLPAAMPAWQQTAARGAHALFYGLMIGLPLSGWLLVSAQWRDGQPLNVPTLWFGLFEAPHLFGLDRAANETRAHWAEGAQAFHQWLARGMAALLVLHVGAALKHHFIEHDSVLTSMAPNIGLLVVPLVAAAVIYGVAREPGAGSSATSATRITQTGAGPWQLRPEASALEFSGTHAGAPFRGRFTRWQATLDFDPARPETSRLSAVIEAASARTGNSLHEETLPEAEWFDVARHPHLRYESTRITPSGEGRYAVEGLLTMKGRAHAAPLRLEVADGRLRLLGGFELTRAALDLGLASDPKADYVSARIGVHVQVEAGR